jgi:hypothetical protein
MKHPMKTHCFGKRAASQKIKKRSIRSTTKYKQIHSTRAGWQHVARRTSLASLEDRASKVIGLGEIRAFFGE